MCVAPSGFIILVPPGGGDEDGRGEDWGWPRSKKKESCADSMLSELSFNIDWKILYRIIT